MKYEIYNAYIIYIYHYIYYIIYYIYLCNIYICYYIYYIDIYWNITKRKHIIRVHIVNVGIISHSVTSYLVRGDRLYWALHQLGQSNDRLKRTNEHIETGHQMTCLRTPRTAQSSWSSDLTSSKCGRLFYTKYI